jgi:hypothetical protein
MEVSCIYINYICQVQHKRIITGTQIEVGRWKQFGQSQNSLGQSKENHGTMSSEQFVSVSRVELTREWSDPTCRNLS